MARRETPAQRNTRYAKEQKPAVAPMGTGGEMGYGQGTEAMQAQNALPGMPASAGMSVPPPMPVIAGENGLAATAIPPTDEQTLQAARGYQPDVMAMNAPDDDPTIEIIAGLHNVLQSKQTLRERKVDIARQELLTNMAETGTGQMRLLAENLRLNSSGL